MSVLTSAIYNLLAADTTLTGMLSVYHGQPAIFTMDPAPGDADTPYIVTAGDIAQVPFDTKTSLGRTVTRDIRCYADDDGNPVAIEVIAERVRTLLHRQSISVAGYIHLWSVAAGPSVADELDAYGRIVTLTITLESELELPPGFADLGGFNNGFNAGFN